MIKEIIKSRYFKLIFIPFLIYFSIDFIYFGRQLFLNGLTNGYIGTNKFGANVNFSYAVWMLAWFKYAVFHFKNPVYSRMIFAPKGINFAWNPQFMPFYGILCMPFTVLIGAVRTANLLVFLQPVLNSLSCFVLCYYITKKSTASIVGGYFYGFSPYIFDGLSQGLINTTSIFIIPLLVLAALMFYGGKIGKWKFTVVSALLLTSLFYIFRETYATVVLFGFIFLVLAFIYDKSNRKSLLILSKYLTYSFIFSLIFAAPMAYYMLVKYPYWGPKFGRSRLDLLSFFIPNNLVWFMHREFANLTVLSAPWKASGYIGLPLIIIFIWFIERYRAEIKGKVLIVFAIILVIASLGRPTLLIGGVPTIFMPWQVFKYIPLINDAVPHRFSLYLFLIMSVAASVYLSDKKIKIRERVFLSGLAVLFLLPNLNLPYYSKYSVPAFFKNKTYQKYIKKNRNVLLLSRKNYLFSMLYQAKDGFYYKLAGGGFQGPDTGSFAHGLGYFGFQVLKYNISPDITICSTKPPIIINNMGGLKVSEPVLVDRCDSAVLSSVFSTIYLSSERFLKNGNNESNLLPSYLEERGYLGKSFGYETNNERGYYGKSFISETNRHAANWTKNGGWLGWRSCPGGKGECFGVGIMGNIYNLKPIIAKYKSRAVQIFFPYPKIYNAEKGRKVKKRGIGAGLLLMIFKNPGNIKNP